MSKEDRVQILNDTVKVSEGQFDERGRRNAENNDSRDRKEKSGWGR